MSIMALCNQPILILGPQENSKRGRWSCPRCWMVSLNSRPLPTGPFLGCPSSPDRALSRTKPCNYAALWLLPAQPSGCSQVCSRGQ